MEEQIYQSVWCQVFAATWMRTQKRFTEEWDRLDVDAIAEEEAPLEACSAAAAAVRQWSAAKQLAAITAKNKENP